MRGVSFETRGELKQRINGYDVRVRKAEREIKRLQKEIENCRKWKKDAQAQLKRGELVRAW